MFFGEESPSEQALITARIDYLKHAHELEPNDHMAVVDFIWLRPISSEEWENGVQHMELTRHSRGLTFMDWDNDDKYIGIWTHRSYDENCIYKRCTFVIDGEKSFTGITDRNKGWDYINERTGIEQGSIFYQYGVSCYGSDDLNQYILAIYIEPEFRPKWDEIYK